VLQANEIASLPQTHVRDVITYSAYLRGWRYDNLTVPPGSPPSPHFALIAACGPQNSAHEGVRGREDTVFTNSVVADTFRPGLGAGRPEFGRDGLSYLRACSKRPWGISSFLYTATFKAALRHIQLSLYRHIQSGPEAHPAFFMRPHSERPWGTPSFLYATTFKAALRHTQLSLCGHIQSGPEARPAFFMRSHSERPWCTPSFLYAVTFIAALRHTQPSLCGHIQSGPEAHPAFFMRSHS
jgi:hypothetical protein